MGSGREWGFFFPNAADARRKKRCKSSSELILWPVSAKMVRPILFYKGTSSFSAGGVSSGEWQNRGSAAFYFWVVRGGGGQCSKRERVWAVAPLLLQSPKMFQDKELDRAVRQTSGERRVCLLLPWKKRKNTR